MVNYENIPAELRELPNWVVYKREERIDASGERKTTKVPYQISGGYAKTNDPSTWGSFQSCVEAAESGKYDGIGFVFTNTDYVGIDLDHVHEAAAGLELWAAEVMKRLSSYTERSASGDGIHVIVRGSLPGGRHRKARIEMYDKSSPRYFVMTGNHLPGTPANIEERTAEVAAIHVEYVADAPRIVQPQASASAPAAETDEELLTNAGRADIRFGHLYYGDFQKSERFPSQSEADADLCRMLCYYTGGDEVRIDALFRGSKLYREKWDRADYRASTINYAGEHPYTPPPAFDLAPFFAGAGYILPGQRRNILRGIAARLHKLHYDEENALDILRQANRLFSSPPVEDEALIDDVVRWSQRSPYTDTGNAQMFALKHGQNVRWCEAEGVWLCFSGGRCVPLGKSPGYLTQQTLNAIYCEAEGLDAEEARKATRWAHKTASGGHLNTMVDIAKTMLPTEPDDYDTDQFLFAVANGVVDLRTGRLREARREDLMRLASPVTFDESANCPRWLQFLEEVFDGDQEMIGYMQTVVGYSLTGVTTEHCFFYLQGKGANGKSTLAKVLEDLMGDYGGTCARSMLLEKRPGAPTNDIATLRGKRLVVGQELRDGDKLDEAALKGLTSGDPQQVRGMYKEFFRMVPRFKLFITANPLPNVTGTDDGFWRRMKLVPFRVSFLGREDLTLGDKLNGELPGILNWAIEGCLRWQRDGRLIHPTAVTSATTELREELDFMVNYITERCTVDSRLSVRANAIYSDYKLWAEERGEGVRSQALFGRRLSAVEGVAKHHDRGGAKYRGIALQVESSGDDED